MSFAYKKLNPADIKSVPYIANKQYEYDSSSYSDNNQVLFQIIGIFLISNPRNLIMMMKEMLYMVLQFTLLKTQLKLELYLFQKTNIVKE